MTITTKDIIKLLPFEPEFKTKMLGGFDSLTPDQKFEIEQILWDAYSAFYKLTLDTQMKIAMLKVNGGQEILDKGFYERVKKQAEDLIEKGVSENASAMDLSDVRSNLEKFLNNLSS